jgi:hypothetical protein
MIVVLDTNIWLAELGLHSPLGAVARLFLEQKRARLALPEVVRLEVEHNLRRQLTEHVNILQDRHRKLLTVFGTLKELVVPDIPAIEEQVGAVFRDLGIEVLEIPFSLTSAKSSFLKTVEKAPPSDRTQEFKDGVLWADCMGLLNEDDVSLVTADKAFFQGRDCAKGLSNNLAAEIANAPHALTLLPSLDQLVLELQVNVSIDENILVDAYFRKSKDTIAEMLKRHGFVLGEKVRVSKILYATENPSMLYVEFTIELEAKDTVGDVRCGGLLTVCGDGSYDIKQNVLAELRVLDEILHFQKQGGEEQEVRNVYAFAESFHGHRIVSHRIRQRLA